LFCQFVFGGGLEALELAEGAVEGALDAGFVAAQEGQGVGAADVALVEIGEAGARGQALVALGDIFGVIGPAELEEATFDEAEAAETPGGHDDLLDEEGLEGADGLELVLEGLAGFVEFVHFLAFDANVFGGEAVGEGVLADDGLALGGFGTGALLSVLAISVDLLLRCHGGGSLRSDSAVRAALPG
jgi:hypothetical protein